MMLLQLKVFGFWLYLHKVEVLRSIGLDDTTLERMRSIAEKVVLQCVLIQINFNVLIFVNFFVFVNFSDGL
jgi:hypothetical protein